MDGHLAGTTQPSAPPSRLLRCRARQWRVLDHPVVAHAAAEFTSGFEDATLQFFDAALPFCRRLIDVGGYLGMLSLYAADRVEEVTVYEPSPSHQAFLQANLALNPESARRTTIVPAALAAEAGEHTLYRKAFADSGASLFPVVERQRLLRGAPEATVSVLEAAPALVEAGLDAATLLKIDIEGAEYEVIPAIADLLHRGLPFLQVSFHPFNLVAEGPAIATTLLRLRRMLDVVEALRAYDYWYVPTGEGWREVTPASLPAFVDSWLLQPKPVARIATPQYGFIEGLGFSRRRLDLQGVDAPRTGALVPTLGC